MAGLYLHIPFCKKRCVYCGFFSTTHLQLRQPYVDALCMEMSMRKEETESVETIYLGGGTPSMLSGAMLHQIFQAIDNSFHVIPHAEITIECNPDDVNDSFVSLLSDLPINRVSIGVQSFSDKHLLFLGRRHAAAQSIESLRRLRNAGINNISIDLMFGLPGQTLQEWQYDINMAIDLGVEHISAYSLMIEEGTPLYHLKSKGEIKETDDETYNIMYSMLVDQMRQAGYEHYEISNFARKGYHSCHNSNYWNGTPYIGVGAGAHSYHIVSRSWNVEDIWEYIDSIRKGRIPSKTEELSLMDRYNDIITTTMRTSTGILLTDIEQQFGKQYLDYLLRMSQRWIHNDCLALKNNRIHLTYKGVVISDTIMSDLIMLP